MILWATGILLTLGAVAAVTATSTDLGRFRLATIRIKHCPEGLIARRFGMNTLDSFGVWSGAIAESVDKTYDELSAAFAVPPKTYYSECGDCPTQETIWQFPGYFVRLYATSALESDAAEVGVFAGTYETFRGERLLSSDPWTKFALIECKSPRRFLSPNR